MLLGPAAHGQEIHIISHCHGDGNQTPEMFLEEKQLREQLYTAVMALPEKQAKRIYARYYLGMRVGEIAAAEGVDPSRVRDSIRRGLKQLAKYF